MFVSDSFQSRFSFVFYGLPKEEKKKREQKKLIKLIIMRTFYTHE